MWRMVVDNWPLKLLALVLAVLVWLYANSVVTRTTTIEATLDIAHPPTVEVTVSPERRQVSLVVSGPASVIEELSRRSVRMGGRPGGPSPPWNGTNRARWRCLPSPPMSKRHSAPRCGRCASRPGSRARPSLLSSA